MPLMADFGGSPLNFIDLVVCSPPQIFAPTGDLVTSQRPRFRGRFFLGLMRPAPEVQPMTHSCDGFSRLTHSVLQERGVTGAWILTRCPVRGSSRAIANPL